jgi:hypothetical protein
MILESLESRQLLSVSPVAAEVSALARPKPFQVVGSLTGTFTVLLKTPPANSIVATGEVGTLGSVQLQSTFPEGPRPHGFFTITSAQGTMTFAAKPIRNGYTFTALKHGTGAYTGWTGTGTLKMTFIGVSQPPAPEQVSFSLQLTLKA